MQLVTKSMNKDNVVNMIPKCPTSVIKIYTEEQTNGFILLRISNVNNNSIYVSPSQGLDLAAALIEECKEAMLINTESGFTQEI